jgi:molybdate transport system ATP-binding protein
MITVNIEKKLKAYRGQQVLKIDARFESGTITKIYGPSGAGKTTFLKIIAGLVETEKGKIAVDDVVWLNTGAKVNLPPQKRKAGFVFQNYALFPNMTIREHLEYATGNIKWINRLLKIGQLENFADHKPEHLSGGQQQRVSILRALAIQPRVLLMDEPFSALDPKTKLDLIPELKSLWDEFGTTVLIVSHNPQELESLYANAMVIDPA